LVFVGTWTGQFPGLLPSRCCATTSIAVPIAASRIVHNRQCTTIRRPEQELDEKKGDQVAFGRPFIVNPDPVDKLATGTLLRQPDPERFYTPGPEGFTEFAWAINCKRTRR